MEILEEKVIIHRQSLGSMVVYIIVPLQYLWIVIIIANVHSLGHAYRKNANPGEKVEKLSSSTGENTQTNKSPSSSSKNYVLMAPDSSKNPVMAKSSSQGSTDEEKTTEGKGEMEGGVVETSVQDPDGQQDRVSAHSQGSGSQEQIEEEKVRQWFMCSCACDIYHLHDIYF